MEFPEGIKDKKAYLKYLVLLKEPILNKRISYTTSEGEEIKMTSFVHIIKKKIEHLSDKEQKKILDRKAEYTIINNRLTQIKLKAFGKSNIEKANKGKDLYKENKDRLLDLFGKFFTIEEVLKESVMVWGVPATKKGLQLFKTQNHNVIEERKEKFKATYSDVRLGVKRSRLEELTYLYQHQKDKWEAHQSNENYRLLVSTLEQIRKEAEGDRLTIDGKMDISYEVTIQQHMRNEVFRTINIKEIILGRVAARMGANPIKLIHALNNSYYKEFSNVLGDFDPDNEGEVVYPSQLSYDFERIRKNQAGLDASIEDAVIVDEEKTVETKEPVRADAVKNMLQEMLARKIQGLNTNKKD